MDEFTKIVLQFLFGTAAGIVITAYLQGRKDRRERREANARALRELIRQVDEVYRSSKQIKRALRARLKAHTDGWAVDGAFFEGRMDELSKVQLALEQLQQVIRTRTDLFKPVRRERIRGKVAYADEYFREVVRQFEERKVALDEGRYILDETGFWLWDYVGTSDPPEPLNTEFKSMESDAPEDAREKAWQRIVEAHGEGERRYKRIAVRCLRSVLAEMRQMILDEDVDPTSRNATVFQRFRQ